MSEIQPAPVRPKPERQPLTFAGLQERAIAKELGRFPGLKAWYENGVKSFPEMTTTRGKVALSDAGGYETKPKKDAEGKTIGVESIGNPAFMNVEAVEVARGGKVTHSQAGLFEATQTTHITTEYGDADLDTSAYVGVILNSKGQVLAGLGQEPLADTPNKVVIKTPLQTSAGKFDLVFGDPEHGIPGDPSRDQAFYDTVKIFFPENTREEFFTYLAQPGVLWPMGPINGNRLNSPNIAFAVMASPEQEEQLIAAGHRFITKEERIAAERAGIMNTIASAAFDAA